jgi:hypothetical protein
MERRIRTSLLTNFLVTYTTTSACSTYQKPIYNTPIPEMPCYVCACKSQGIPTNQGFITATTVSNQLPHLLADSSHTIS